MLRILFVMVVAAVLGTRAAGGPVTFTNFVDTSGPYSLIDTALPAVSDNGRIAFTALLRAGGSGIFIGPDPLQHTVADTSGPFGGMSNPAINDSGEVVFRASFDDPTLTIPYDETTGLFRGPNPATDTIIDNTGNLSRFGTIAINNAGRVAYVAYSDDTTPGNPADDSGGVYVQSGSTPQLVADASGAFRIFSCVGITPTGVPLFKADLDNSARGIFAGGDPVADRIVGSAGPFFDLRCGYKGTPQHLIFAATIDPGFGSEGIYDGPDPATDALIDSSGPFKSFGSFDVNGLGELAFTASTDSDVLGIFTGPDPVGQKVIAEGDPLFDSTVSFVRLAHLADNGAITFSYELTDGRRGIAVSHVPEPAAGAPIMMTCGAALRRRRAGAAAGIPH